MAQTESSKYAQRMSKRIVDVIIMRLKLCDIPIHEIVEKPEYKLLVENYINRLTRRYQILHELKPDVRMHCYRLLSGNPKLSIEEIARLYEV